MGEPDQKGANEITQQSRIKSYQLDAKHITLRKDALPNAPHLCLFNTEHDATVLPAFHDLIKVPRAQDDLWTLTKKARTVMKDWPMYYRMLVRKINKLRPSMIAPLLAAASKKPSEQRTLIDRVVVDLNAQGQI